MVREMKNNVLYVYGYGSSPEGHTATWLRENLPNSKVYSFKYDQYHPDVAIPYLCQLVHDLDIDIIFGSSLGAWYAMHVASICSLPGIYINPVTDETLASTIEYVSSDNRLVNNLVKYSEDHPLFCTKDHWTRYRWDDCEDGHYSILIWSDNDEVIRRKKILPTEFHQNFLTKYIVPNGNHQLTDEEKKAYLIPAYDRLVNVIIPKVNNFYKKTLIIP